MSANKYFISSRPKGGGSGDVAGDTRPRNPDDPDHRLQFRGRGLFVELPQGEEDLLQWLVTSDNVELVAGDGSRVLQFRLESSAREHDSEVPRLQLGYPSVIDRAGPARGLRVQPRVGDQVIVADTRGRLRDAQLLDLSSTGLKLWHAGHSGVREGWRMSGLRLVLPGQPLIEFTARVVRVNDAEPARGGQYLAVALDEDDISPGDRLAIRQYILDRHLDD